MSGANPAPGNDPQARLSVVQFACPPYTCMLDARQVLSMSAEPGAVHPIEHWLGLPDPHTSNGRRFLRLRTPSGTLTVAVSEPVRLLDIDPLNLHPLPALLGAACRLPALRALYVHQGHWQLVLSSHHITTPPGT